MKLLTKNELMLCSGGVSYLTTTERMNVEGISEPCVQAMYQLALHSMTSDLSDYTIERVLGSNCTIEDIYLTAYRIENTTVLNVTLS